MVGRTGDATVGDATVEPRYTIEIVNVVASTGIGQEINLKQTTLALEGADYDPERFPGLVYRTKDPKTAAPVSYTHLRAHETRHDLVCRLLLEKKKQKKKTRKIS